MCKTFEKSENYEKIAEFYIDEFKSYASYYKNRKNGLEIVHLKNKDPENLFAFAFRTPQKSSTGVQHILEHSVLCGSQKFPLKDPFIILANQSVNTFLNALTYPDRTIYPASSIIKSDFFNLLYVYADAVFFPNLSEGAFLQEGIRIEEEDGKFSFQGVVFNEMKGAYSDFDSVVEDLIIKSLSKNTIYEFDSGGDPLVIPELDYEKFCAFHKKYYVPQNCLLFLWGDIPLNEITDFLDEKIFCRFSDFPKSSSADYLLEFKNFTQNLKTCVDENVDENFEKSTNEKSENLKIENLENQKISAEKNSTQDSKTCENKSSKNLQKIIREIAPGNNSLAKPTVLLNFDLGTTKTAIEQAELLILMRLLYWHPGSPLKKALLESSLGEDLSASAGMVHSICKNIFSAGLRAVKKDADQKVFDVIFSVLQEKAKNGFSKDEIDSAFLSLEYETRDMNRAEGPFSLVVMGNFVYGWTYGFDFEKFFIGRKTFAELKQKIDSNPEFLKNLIKKHFLQNKNISFLVVTPSKNFSKNREKIENELLKSKIEQIGKSQIQKKLQILKNFQNQKDDPSLIDHVRVADFLNDEKTLCDKIKTEIKFFAPFNFLGNENLQEQNAIPFIKNCEETNGLVHFSVGFPADVLDEEDYKILSILIEVATSSGFSNLDWAEAAKKFASCSQGISGSIFCENVPNTQTSKNLCKKNPLLLSREWFVFKISFVEEKLEEALKTLFLCIKEPNFSDFKRNRDIICELKNDLEGAFVPMGHHFVNLRATRKFSRIKAIAEILNGFTLYFTILDFLKKSDLEISQKFSSLMKKIRSSGAFFHAVCEEKNLQKIEELLPLFIKDLKICSLTPKKNHDEKKFFDLTELSAKKIDENAFGEFFSCSTQVGFSAKIASSSFFSEKNAAAEVVCAHWLTSTVMWEKFRTELGSYGAWCKAQTINGFILLMTYRDPTPEKSCEIFAECIESALKREISQEECEKAIIGCYSSLIQPLSSAEKGGSALLRILYAHDDDERIEFKKKILSVTVNDMKNALLRMLQSIKKSKTYAIIATKNQKKYRKIIEIPV